MRTLQRKSTKTLSSELTIQLTQIEKQGKHRRRLNENELSQELHMRKKAIVNDFEVNLKILYSRLILYGLLLMESHMYVLKVRDLQIAYASINVNLI